MNIKISDFIKDSELLVSARGGYNVVGRHLDLALSEWLETGVSPMSEHIKLTHIKWSGYNPSHDYDTLHLLDALIDNDTFWHWSIWFNDLGEVKEIRDKLESELKTHESYPNRRRIANAFNAKKSTRVAVFTRDDCRCVNCGSSDNLSIDHIHPVRLGGDNGLDNLQTLCNSCNSSKGGSV